MSKMKDKAIDEQNATPKGMADVLKECEGVTVTDENRLRVTAPDGKTLNELAEAVVQKLGEFGDVRVSPKHGGAAVTGCVWYDIIVKPKR